MGILCSVFCNGHGWIMGIRQGEIVFTKMRFGAKLFDYNSEELEDVKIKIEHSIMCNYDVVMN